MDPNSASIIGAVLGATLAALVGWALTYFLNYEAHPYYEKISRKIMSDLKGKWSGEFNQQLNDKPINVKLIFALSVSRTGKIKGEINYSFQNIEYKIIVRGGFYSTDFLKLEYVNPKHPSRQFGSFVLAYDGISKNLNGRFVGYGNINRNIISGSIELTKEQEAKD